MRTAFALATSIMLIAGVYMFAHGIYFLITGDHKLPPVANAITAFISIVWSFACMAAIMDDSPEKEENNEDPQGN